MPASKTRVAPAKPVPAATTKKAKVVEAEVTPSASKVKSKIETKKPSKHGATPSEKKPAVKPAKAEKVIAGAKRGPKQKAGKAADVDELDMSDIEEDLVGEPETAEASTEKVKPLRMKISKAKERALMKEFGLDETVLTEEEMLKRRQSTHPAGL